MQDSSERLSRMEGTLDRIERRLFGNGQPGEIAIIKLRVSRLEWYLALSIGGGAAILWIIERVVNP